jgi:hypothetical protein
VVWFLNIHLNLDWLVFYLKLVMRRIFLKNVFWFKRFLMLVEDCTLIHEVPPSSILYALPSLNCEIPYSSISFWSSSTKSKLLSFILSTMTSDSLFLLSNHCVLLFGSLSRSCFFSTIDEVFKNYGMILLKSCLTEY